MKSMSAVFVLLSACSSDPSEPDPDPFIPGYLILGRADVVETATVPKDAQSFAYLVGAATDFSSIACTSSISVPMFAGDRVPPAGPPVLPMHIGFSFTEPITSPVRLKVFASLTPDRLVPIERWRRGQPPILAGDLYGESSVIELQPGMQPQDTFFFLMDQVFGGCP